MYTSASHNTAQKHIWLKAVGMDDDRHWMITDRISEREKVRQNKGIHTKAYKILNGEICQLTTKVK